MLVLCLILFGLLQIFLLYTTQEVTDYVAFRTARSLSVGFADELIEIEARARAVPVSGSVLTPSHLKAQKNSGYTTSQYSQNNGVYDYFYRLKRAVLHYMEGVRYMECEYWNGKNSFKTKLISDFSTDDKQVLSEVKFSKYPLRLPFSKAFLTDKYLDINSSMELKNHSSSYLE